MTDTDPQAAPDEVVGEFPVSTTQERCWFLDRLKPGNPALNVAVRWEVRGQISASDLERAFQHVVDRHEILRTRFIERDGAPVQQVVAHVPFHLAQLDLRTAGADDPLARIDAIAHEDAERPFDLTKPGLLRATLVRFAADRAMLLIVAHQSCFDGYSIGVLGHEVGTAAAAFAAGRTPDLPELPLQYGDYALWQKEYLESGVLEEEAAYWTEQLRGAPYFEVPADKPRPAVRGTAAAQRHLDLPEGFAARLEAAARAEGVSPFTLGSAILAGCLHRVTGAGEVLFGTQIAGRNEVELEPLIGVFINNLVLRQTTSPDTPVRVQIAAAKRVVEGALAHQAMPFNRLVERVNPVRDAGRTPLISVNFNLQQVFLKDRDYGPFQLISVPSHAPGAVYDLNVVIIGRPSGWRMNIEYAADLFERETVDALLETIRDGFDAALADPAMRLGDLPLAPALAQRGQAERQALRAVEEALAVHPFVGEAAAVPNDGAPFAFVTASPTCTEPLETLPELLIAHLSGTEAPEVSGISVLAGFPRTSLGAINRALLKPRPGKPAPAKARAVDADVTDRLRAQWKEVLSVDDVPPTASFFDLGGHSLLAVRLLTRIREAWGVDLGIATIYEHPTLPALAEIVSAELAGTATREAEDWRILPLRREGEGTPLIAINNAATALAISQGLSRPRPATCVRLFDADRGIDQSVHSFEEIAEAYAEVVRKAQPDGPYLFYGNCLHGNLALETARVLQRDGAEIAGVVMKDVWEPAYADRIATDPKTKWREKLFALHVRLRQVRAGTLSVSAMLGSYRIVRKSGLLTLAERLRLIDRVRTTDLEEEQEAAIQYLSAARNRYRPGPIDVPVLHVVTGITPQGRGFSPSVGWEDVVTGRLKTVQINEVLVHRDRKIGTEALAREIEIFLAEGAAGQEMARG